MCRVGDRLAVAWRSRGRQLNIRTSGSDGWGPPASLAHRSTCEPAICEHRGYLVLAWIGTGRRINVALLPPT